MGAPRYEGLRIKVGLGSRVGLLWAFETLTLRNRSYEGGGRGHRPLEDEELR